jgi:hypothetical protein
VSENLPVGPGGTPGDGEPQARAQDGDPQAGPPDGRTDGDRQDAVLRAVLELEHHVAAGGWDGPVRLFALIRTADALHRDPQLEAQLPVDVVAAAYADPEHLTAVEQEDLPAAETLEELLGRIAWPPTVDGAALVTERIVVPPEVEAQIPDGGDGDGDPVDWLARHPSRRDVRLAAGVLRDGTRGCAVRARDQDSDDRVAVGPDLVPGLTAALASTLEG